MIYIHLLFGAVLFCFLGLYFVAYCGAQIKD